MAMSAFVAQSSPKRILIIAGEPSGDLQAALLLAQVRKLRPEWSFFGVGGPRMVQQGLEQLVGIEELGVIGFAGVVRKAFFFRRVFARMEHAMRERKPDAVLLVDYPGFNLRFARRARRQGVKVVYYIAPQVWAWGEQRVKILRTAVDLLVAVFPFEDEYFHSRGVNVFRVGHPLLDVVHADFNRGEFRRQYHVPSPAKLIALLPGSRPGEVQRHLPVMLAAVSKLGERFSPLAPMIACAPGIAEQKLRSISARCGAPDALMTRDVYSLLAACDAALVKSGTGTVECAILRTPFVVLYKTGRINFLIARRLIKTPHLAMVNLIAGKSVVPEFIQDEATPARLAAAVGELLSNPHYRELMLQELDRVREKLGPPGGAQQAAEIIVEFLERVEST